MGAVLPIPFWLYHRKYPSSWANLINTPILLNGVAYIPPAVGINYSSWFLVGFIFQFIIRRRNFAWWSKFNYVTSAAMDSGEYLLWLSEIQMIDLGDNPCQEHPYRCCSFSSRLSSLRKVQLP